MATQVQIRRGTSSQVAAFTGAEGEIVVNTTNDSIHVNDGSSAGGFEMARVDGSNWAITNAISTTANISFGDNDKAIFGAGSDLQIYHDGSNSIISDQGTGSINLLASNYFRVKNSADTLLAASFRADAGQEFYHNSSLKLATTSTGIDVTGTVTADGLTVAGTARVSGTGSGLDTIGATLIVGSTPNGPKITSVQQHATDTDFEGLQFYTKSSLAFGDSPKLALQLNANNDISFYEDTGTTAKLFWDASAESLGIGTSSPSSATWSNFLQVEATYPGVVYNSTAGGSNYKFSTGVDDDKWLIRDETAAATRLIVDSSGNLLVGCTSVPSASVTGFAVRDLSFGWIHTSYDSTNTRSHHIFYNPNGAVGAIQTSGSSTLYNTSSDYRLKENVVALTGATERLKKLNPSRFNFIADADVTVDGFLAHEVQDIVPEAITGTKDAVDDDGNPVYQGIDQSKLVPLLVATIQELEARITQLENN